VHVSLFSFILPRIQYGAGEGVELDVEARSVASIPILRSFGRFFQL